MPKGQPQRSASMSEDDALALRLVSLLNDDQVLDKLKSVLYPHALAEQLKSLIENIDGLKRQITKKDEIIENFEKRVSALEAEQDRQEQYSRRPNLRIEGLAESQEGTTDDKVLHLINTEMSFEPPLVLEDIERSHRLGPSQDREGRPRIRPVIVRFRTERLRDSVYRARTRLKEHNKNHRDAVFINEDLTQRRAAMAYQTRKLKAAQKISDCWTYNGIVVVKERNNTIKKVNAPHDLDIYQ